MFLRLLLIVLLIYLVVRAVGNLIRAIRHDDGPSSPSGYMRPPPEGSGDAPPRREGQPARRAPHAEVEDAKWRDIP
jgi:hypothetical protein